MKIVFVHPHKAFLPDIDAYKEYFARYNINCVTATPDRFQHTERDIEWFFMGVDRSPRTPSICRIHEYVSASIPPFSRQKDRLKKWINQRPDFRIFQNQFVRDRLGFKDPVPFGFRLPCLAPIWYQPITPREKKFDFVYIGDLSTQRGIVPLLDHFCGPLKEHSLLLLSRDYDRLKKKYERATNITFEGPLQQEAVRNKLLECRFAINFIPDRLPFSHQVSTKLLEYAACRIPIITTDYAWIRDFERQEGGQYFFLSRDLNNFTWAAVNAFTYAYPEKKTYQSEEQIRRSGVISFLHERFPGTLLC